MSIAQLLVSGISKSRDWPLAFGDNEEGRQEFMLALLAHLMLLSGSTPDDVAKKLGNSEGLSDMQPTGIIQ